MNNLLSYLIQSTLCLSLFWLMFRMVMRKEHHFGLTRMLLVTIVLLSVAIPFIPLPVPIQSPVRIEMLPAFAPVEGGVELNSPDKLALTEVASTEIPQTIVNVGSRAWPSIPQLLFYGYLTGCLLSLLLLIRGLVSVLLLTRKARSITMEGFRLLVVEQEVPAFSFGRWVVLSQNDYEQHRLPLLAHEQAHIRLYHFFDLLLLETVRIFHWFNPVINWLIKDLKDIHEFQADDYTLINGIDATQYQLLIIQKGVGSQRFALANSFNHCQIKKRITMMNQSKTNKAGSWKVATFLPLLALLLMAFGRSGKNVPEKINMQAEIAAPSVIVQKPNELTDQIIEIKKEGNYIDNKLSSLEEIVKKGQEWNKANNKWILLLIDESISLNRIDEVREALAEAKVYFVTQSSVNSDDIVYFAGDVSDGANFTQGKWSDWIISQQINSTEIKSKIGQFKLAYSFIVDRNGKVKDAHLIKRCDFPEVNAAYEKILTQIPDWEPARRGSSKVSVYYRFSGYARYVKAVIKK